MYCEGEGRKLLVRELHSWGHPLRCLVFGKSGQTQLKIDGKSLSEFLKSGYDPLEMMVMQSRTKEMHNKGGKDDDSDDEHEEELRMF